MRDVKLRAWICRLMDVFWTLNRRPYISGFSREQLPPSTHNESAPEQCVRCSVQDCMAEMVSIPWCRPRYDHLHPSTAATRYKTLVHQQHKHKHSGEIPAGSTKTTTGTSSKNIELCHPSHDGNVSHRGWDRQEVPDVIQKHHQGQKQSRAWHLWEAADRQGPQVPQLSDMHYSTANKVQPACSGTYALLDPNERYLENTPA